MGGRIKKFLGITRDIPDFDQVIQALHSDVARRNSYFHLFIIAFECIMAVSISMRPGGPFAKPRRVAYFSCI